MDIEREGGSLKPWVGFGPEKSWLSQGSASLSAHGNNVWRDTKHDVQKNISTKI